MTTPTDQTVLQKAIELIEKSSFQITDEERQKLAVNDFGLGRLEVEGFAFIDILRTPRVRITLLILLPNQSLPQHMHPPYEQETGKEETLRVLYGQTKVYVKGQQNNPDMVIPEGKDAYYTARHEIALSPGQSHTIDPNIEHWFQAGPEGSVNLAFQNRVDETKNLFYDLQSTGCPIKPTDT
jgi:D-lyxose ketol-isomerase